MSVPIRTLLQILPGCLHLINVTPHCRAQVLGQGSYGAISREKILRNHLHQRKDLISVTFRLTEPVLLLQIAYYPAFKVQSPSALIDHIPSHSPSQAHLIFLDPLATSSLPINRRSSGQIQHLLHVQLLLPHHVRLSIHSLLLRTLPVNFLSLTAVDINAPVHAQTRFLSCARSLIALGHGFLVHIRQAMLASWQLIMLLHSVRLRSFLPVRH